MKVQQPYAFFYLWHVTLSVVFQPCSFLICTARSLIWCYRWNGLYMQILRCVTVWALWVLKQIAICRKLIFGMFKSFQMRENMPVTRKTKEISYEIQSTDEYWDSMRIAQKFDKLTSYEEAVSTVCTLTLPCDYRLHHSSRIHKPGLWWLNFSASHYKSIWQS